MGMLLLLVYIIQCFFCTYSGIAADTCRKKLTKLKYAPERVHSTRFDKKKITIYESYDDFLIKKKNSRVIVMTTKTKNNCFSFKFDPNISMKTCNMGKESKLLIKKRYS